MRDALVEQPSSDRRIVAVLFEQVQIAIRRRDTARKLFALFELVGILQKIDSGLVMFARAAGLLEELKIPRGVVFINRDTAFSVRALINLSPFAFQFQGQQMQFKR